MNKRKKPETTEKVVISGKPEEACTRYGYGRATMLRIASEANAIIRFGKSVNIFYPKVDDYLRRISQSD